MMLIDSHIHLDFGGLSDSDFIERVEKGLTDIFMLSALHGGYYPRENDVQASNDAVHKLMRRLPDNVIGFAYVNPVCGEHALSELKRCVEELGFKGIKLWVATLCDDPRVFPIVEQAIEYGIPLLVHCWVKIDGNLPFESTPMHLRRLAQRFPGATFIMAHLGGDWEYGLKVARECENVYVDTSGSMAEQDCIEKLAETIGVHRLLFGTDNSDLAFCKAKIFGADLKAEEREAIFWQNAARLMKLKQ
ncbi:amidohydrolase [candidate division KSB1 bacterium]|nr:amidohydrolase [candidate division KSB1 bacterium]